MALQNFTAKGAPAVSAAWLNVVDNLKFTVFGDSITKATARTALTSDAPLEVANGGTGLRTLDADLPWRGVAICKFKSGTTQRTNATLANDPDLTYAVPSAGTYRFEIQAGVFGTTTGTQGFAFGVNYSGTYTSNSSLYSTDGVANQVAVALLQAPVQTPFGSGRSYATINTALGTDFVRVIGVLVATGVGTLGFDWAQASNVNANGASVIAGSYMTVTLLS